MNITDRTTVKAIFNSCSATGVEAPKALTDAYERTVRISDAARALGVGQGAVADAVYQALDAGRDPAGDKQVIRVLTAGQLDNPGIAQAVDSRAYADLLEVCVQHADGLVDAWRVPFDRAADQLLAIHGVAGPTPLDDSAAWLRRGGDAAGTWATAQSAQATIAAVESGWSALGQFTRLAPADPRHRALRLVDASFEQWQANELAGRKLSPWELVCSGLELGLASFSEYADRVRRIATGAQRALEQQAETEAAFHSGRRPRRVAVA